MIFALPETSATDPLDPSLAGGRLTIDLGALVANWRDLGARAPGAECAAVVKADGYGLGIEPVVGALAGAGCRTFFVALPSEGARARVVAPHAAIYVLNGLFEGSAPFLAAHRLRPVLGSVDEIAEWSAFRSAQGGDLPAAIHVDTGMNRLGLSVAEAEGLAADPAALAASGAVLLVSHFACADAPEHPLNAVQLARFAAVRRLFPTLPASLANSAGIFLDKAAHHELLRPGIALYGGAAVAGTSNPMRAVVTLEARIMLVRDVPAGEGVGYSAVWQAPRDSRIAIISVGYADGFLRAAGSQTGRAGAAAAVEGHLAPIVGRVSMDLIALDVTDLPADLARRSAFAELFGPNVPIDRTAARAGTIGYEFLTSLGTRFRRVFLGP